MSAAAQQMQPSQVPETDEIIVWASRDRDGAHFVLHPFTRRYLERVFPGVERFPKLSIDRKHASDFVPISEAVQAHVVALLTGRTIEQWTEQTEVRFMDPVPETTLSLWPRVPR